MDVNFYRLDDFPDSCIALAFVHNSVFLFFFLVSFLLPSFVVTVLMDSLHGDSQSASFASHGGSPYSVMKYISRYGQNSDVRHFGSMQIAGDQL